MTVALDPAYSVIDTPVEIRTSEQVRIDSPAVRILAKNELAWRIVAATPGKGFVDVTVGGITERKSLVTGDQLARLSSSRVLQGWVHEMFYPSEPPLITMGPVRRIDIAYTLREVTIGLRPFFWINAAIALMMVFSLILARIVGIHLV